MDLASYHWPGNVRELENVIERAMILNRSGSLDFSYLKARAPDPSVSDANMDDSLESDLETGAAKVLTENELKRFERRNTIKALTACRWKIYGKDGAARMLTINPTTLIERMKRMQINNLNINILYFMCNPDHGHNCGKNVIYADVVEAFTDLPETSVRTAIDGMCNENLISADGPQSRLSITRTGGQRLQASLACRIHHFGSCSFDC